MKSQKVKKISGRWSKVTHEIATYKYVMDNKDVAAIFPKETRDGKIAWGYYVKRIGSSKEINLNNYETAPVEMAPHYLKKRDAKKAVESVVGVLACP